MEENGKVCEQTSGLPYKISQNSSIVLSAKNNVWLTIKVEWPTMVFRMPAWKSSSCIKWPAKKIDTKLVTLVTSLFSPIGVEFSQGTIPAMTYFEEIHEGTYLTASISHGCCQELLTAPKLCFFLNSLKGINMVQKAGQLNVSFLMSPAPTETDKHANEVYVYFTLPYIIWKVRMYPTHTFLMKPFILR